MVTRKEIRNSTAEFLIFQIEGKEQGVEVYYKDKTVWCTQKAMGMLFDCSSDNIGLHLKNIFASGELVKESVTEKISATASDGKNCRATKGEVADCATFPSSYIASVHSSI